MDIITTALSALSGLIFVFAFFPQTLGIVRKEISPRLVTWLIWAVGDWIILSGSLAQGAIPGGLIIVATIGATLTFILTLQYGERGCTTRDKVCLSLSVLALVLWNFFDDSNYGIAFSLISLVIAAYPMYVVVWHEPEKESRQAWFLFNISSILAVLAIPKLLSGDFHEITFVNAAPPIGFTLIDLPMLYLLFIRPRQRRMSSPT